ncbi:MAG: tail fiber domain-containing protein, partial [Bacteroidia bacterium]|nr:tail fiber domain-containing protein [Bacteroidia bacterium]
ENTPIRFATSSIERVSITGGGDVGIGTMSPNARLEIFSSLPTATTEPHLRIFNPTNSSGATSGLRLSTPGWNIKIQTVQNVDWLQITDATGSVQHAFFGRRFYPGSTSNNNTNTGYILGDGTNIGICTTTPLVPLDVRKQTGHAFGTGVNSNAPTTVIITGSNSAFHNDWPNGWGGGLSVWDICGASTYMTQYLTRSDSRFKTNIQTINPIDIFDKFMNLNPVSYYLNPKEIKANEIDYKRLRFGFLADQVEKLFPNIVVNAKTDNTIHRGIEYDSFIPLLVRVVQEQQKTIEEQKNRIERIEKELKKR